MSDGPRPVGEAKAELEVGRRPRYGRALNIALRTAHIGVTGVLCGGHVFGISPEQLQMWLFWVILTGGLLTAVEAFPHLYWLYQGRGLFVLGKLALLGLCLSRLLGHLRLVAHAGLLLCLSGLTLGLRF